MIEKHKKLIIKISDIVETDSINIDENFIINDSNLDSLSILTLMSAIDQIYQIKITIEQINSSKNVAGLIDLIEKKSI